MLLKNTIYDLYEDVTEGEKTKGRESPSGIKWWGQNKLLVDVKGNKLIQKLEWR